MPSYNSPIRAVAWKVDISLFDFALPGSLKANPTLAAGDCKVSKDNGAFANLATLPSVSPAAGVSVTVDLSGTEMTADKVTLAFIDQTSPKEWTDFFLCILTV